MIALCFRDFFPLISTNYMELLRGSRCYVLLVDIKCMWSWRGLLSESMQETRLASQSKSVTSQKWSPGAQTEPRVEAIRLMITSTALLLASLNGASINSRKLNNYETVFGFTSNSGAFPRYNHIGCCDYLNVYSSPGFAKWERWSKWDIILYFRRNLFSKWECKWDDMCEHGHDSIRPSLRTTKHLLVACVIKLQLNGQKYHQKQSFCWWTNTIRIDFSGLVTDGLVGITGLGAPKKSSQVFTSYLLHQSFVFLTLICAALSWNFHAPWKIRCDFFWKRMKTRDWERDFFSDNGKYSEFYYSEKKKPLR